MVFIETQHAYTDRLARKMQNAADEAEAAADDSCHSIAEPACWATNT